MGIARICSLYRSFSVFPSQDQPSRQLDHASSSELVGRCVSIIKHIHKHQVRSARFQERALFIFQVQVQHQHDTIIPYSTWSASMSIVL